MGQNFETRVEKDVFYWKNSANASDVSAAEAKKLADEAKSILKKPEIKNFLIDNRNLKGVYKPEVNEVWADLMKWVVENVEKNATITADVTLKMQLNRLSRESNTYDKIRAFTDEKEALEFIGSTSFIF